MGEIISGFYALISFLFGVVFVNLFEKKFTYTTSPHSFKKTFQNTAVVRDTWMFYAGPIIAIVGLLLASLVIPFAKNVGSDMTVGLFYFIVVMDFIVMGIAMAGWGANTKRSVEASYRAVAQLLSYVIPLGLSLVGVVMMASSLSTQMIVKAQSDTWFIFYQPLGFALYLAAGLMLSYRNPFAEPFSKNIDGGISSSYTGWLKIVIECMLSGILFIIAAFGTALFLGGWQGPSLVPGIVWFVGKTMFIMIILHLLSRKIPRLSVSQMLGISWKLFIPLGLINVLATGVLILLGVTPK